MNTASKLLIALALVGALTGCRDKAAEKRIAELEARLNSLEGNKANTAATPVTPATAADATTKPETKPAGPLPALDFERVDYDFGTIKEGDKVNYTYKFKNTGAAPLIIQSVQPSCGCTVPNWS